MSTPKAIPKDNSIIKGLHRRIEILETIDLNLEKTELEQKEKIDSQKIKTKQQLNYYHSEVNDLLQEVSSLKKYLYQVGHALRGKISKRELEEIQNEINKWELIAFATRNELNRLYNNYARKNLSQEE